MGHRFWVPLHQFMVSRFGSPDPNWQFARELARRRFSTRPLPIFNFCTYANFLDIFSRCWTTNELYGIARAAAGHQMIELRSDYQLYYFVGC